MQITIQLNSEQEAALNYAAAKAGTPGKPAVPATETSPEIPAVPPIIIAPEAYFRARVASVLASYAEQILGDEGRAVADAFKSASETDRLAVFATLKIDPSSPVAAK